jgi:hypothetical protein
MVDEALRDLSLKLGELRGEMKILTHLDKKMDECIEICQSGHNRITRCEEKIKTQDKMLDLLEGRVNALENAAPFTTDKKLLSVVVLGSAILGSATVELLKAFDFFKLLFAH